MRLPRMFARIAPMNIRWRVSVSECGSPLPLSRVVDFPKRQGAAALQDLAEFGRFMGRLAAKT
jgi:hypothetical protein